MGDIDPNNQTRSDARRSYYDPNIARNNVNVQPDSQVTRILFDQDDQLTAIGVEFATGPSAPRQTVYARREVVLSAGAIHSPQILELSGIGQASVLEPLGVTVLENLPGVGNNLQDHGMIHLDYNLPSTYDDEPSLQAGYERQIATVLSELADQNIPAFENLNNNAGGLDLALMRPLSRGTTHIRSTD